MAPPLRVFICYAHADNELREALYKHLLPLRKSGLFEPWDDRQLAVGDTWETRLSEELEQADMVLALVSTNFIASEYAFGRELTRALERAKAGTTKVVPIIVRPCLFEEIPQLKDLEAPRKGKAPADVNDHLAWTEIAKALSAEGKVIQARKEAAARAREAVERRDEAAKRAEIEKAAKVSWDVERARMAAQIPLTPPRQQSGGGGGRRLLVWGLAVLFAAGSVALAVKFVPMMTAPPALALRVLKLPSPCPDTMIRVEGGTFKMGTKDYADEQPIHDETLKTFCLDKTEVTARAYVACVDAKVCSDVPHTLNISDTEWVKKWGTACTGGKADLREHPINCVSWDEAKAFCAWSNGGRGRLPSEAEWEFAAREREGRKYPWGNTLEPTDNLKDNKRLLNACGPECTENAKKVGWGEWPSMYSLSDAFPTTAPVGSFRDGDTPPQGDSKEGFRDLAGNVWEWVDDLYCDTYERKNCTKNRVNRGGGWSFIRPVLVRGANRNNDVPSARSSVIGFRCARDFP